MRTVHHNSNSHPVLAQTENNTTLWIGHLQTDPHDHFGGQTFACPVEGLLDNIQLYTSAVAYPGEVNLSFHEFDKQSQIWGPAIGHSTLQVEHNDHGKWIRFIMPSLEIKKAIVYGFRLQTDKAMIGLGEAAHDTNHPFTFGHEWHASSSNQAGDYFSYFSLAFKVEMRA